MVIAKVIQTVNIINDKIMFKIKHNSSKTRIKRLDRRIEQKIRNAEKYTLGVIGNSFVRKWARACIDDTASIPSSILPTDLGLITETVSEGELSITGILKHLKCDNVIAGIKVFAFNNINRIADLNNYVEEINSYFELKMLIVDIFSEEIASPESPVSNLMEVIDQFKNWLRGIRSDIVVIALGVIPRFAGLLTPIRKSPYVKKNKYGPDEVRKAQIIFEQRRRAINDTLLQLDAEARNGDGIRNVRFHQITGFYETNREEWVDGDMIHPTAKKLREKYSGQLKRAILNKKNTPVIHELLARPEISMNVIAHGSP